jgi:outer membrane lipoprotein carrier protein
LKKVIGLGGVFLLCSSVSLYAEQPLPDELVQKIQAAYEETGDVKARFIQEATIKSLKKIDREEGVIYFKKPSRMRWVYSKPEGKELVINPQKAWLYIPEDHIVYVQDAAGLFRSKVTIKFLAGVGKLTEDFIVAYDKPKSVNEKGYYILNLIPRQHVAGINRLTMTIHPESFQILRVALTDTQGNTTKTSFSNMEFNKSLSESLFVFKPPDGVDVVELNDKKK